MSKIAFRFEFGFRRIESSGPAQFQESVDFPAMNCEREGRSHWPVENVVPEALCEGFFKVRLFSAKEWRGSQTPQQTPPELSITTRVLDAGAPATSLCSAWVTKASSEPRSTMAAAPFSAGVMAIFVAAVRIRRGSFSGSFGFKKALYFPLYKEQLDRSSVQRDT